MRRRRRNQRRAVSPRLPFTGILPGTSDTHLGPPPYTLCDSGSPLYRVCLSHRLRLSPSLLLSFGSDFPCPRADSRAGGGLPFRLAPYRLPPCGRSRVAASPVLRLAGQRAPSWTTRMRSARPRWSSQDPALKVLVTPPTHPRAGSPPQSPEGLAARDCRRVRDVRHLSWGLQSYFRQMGATFFHSHPPDGGSVPKQCSRFVPISYLVSACTCYSPVL